jgi:hypothetical protein
MRRELSIAAPCGVDPFVDEFARGRSFDAESARGKVAP